MLDCGHVGDEVNFELAGTSLVVLPPAVTVLKEFLEVTLDRVPLSTGRLGALNYDAIELSGIARAPIFALNPRRTTFLERKQNGLSELASVV
jgi:hypothetical protein